MVDKLHVKGKSRTDFVYIYLIFYVFWGFIFTRTVFANSIIVYASFLFLFFAFAAKLISKSSHINSVAIACMPYFLYTSLGYFLQFDFQRTAFWLIALMIIFIGNTDSVATKIKYKQFYIFGIIALIGIFFQFLFPNIYNSHISPLFINDNSEMWMESNYGFNGFTYQLAATAEILVIAEFAVLFLWDKFGFSSHNWVKYTIALALVIGIFMTGKRTNSAIAIITPFLVYIISNSKKKSAKTKLYGLLMVLVLAGGIYLFLGNISNLTESVIFRRTAGAVESYQSGGDYSGGRELMWLRAVNLYRENPVFGIGVGNYVKEGGFDTDVHNIYLQCLCEQGMVGFVLFVLLIVVCTIVSIKETRTQTDRNNRLLLMFSLACQLSYLLEGITENMNVNLDGYMVYAIAVAIMLNCKMNRNGVANVRSIQAQA